MLITCANVIRVCDAVVEMDFPTNLLMYNTCLVFMANLFEVPSGAWRAPPYAIKITRLIATCRAHMLTFFAP